MLKERVADWHSELNFENIPISEVSWEALVFFWQKTAAVLQWRWVKTHIWGSVDTIRYGCPELVTRSSYVFPIFLINSRGSCYWICQWQKSRKGCWRIIFFHVKSHSKGSQQCLLSMQSHLWQALSYSCVPGLAWAVCPPFHLTLSCETSGDNNCSDLFSSQTFYSRYLKRD